MDIRELHEYDIETGQELENSIKRSLEVDEAVAIQEGEALQQMAGADGFKILQSFFEENIRYWRNELLKARELPDIIRCQEIIKSVLSINLWIETKIDRSRQLKEELQTASGSKS